MRRIFQIVSIIFVTGTWGCGVPDDGGSAIEPSAESAETSTESNSHVSIDIEVIIRQMLRIERTLYFNQADGTSVAVQPGTYAVKQSGDTSIQLRPSEGTPVELNAQVGEHEESTKAPQVLAVESGEDEVHIVILLVDGRSLDAAASYSGIATRGRISTKPALSTERIALARMQYPTNQQLQGRVQAATPVTLEICFEKDCFVDARFADMESCRAYDQWLNSTCEHPEPGLQICREVTHSAVSGRCTE